MRALWYRSCILLKLYAKIAERIPQFNEMAEAIERNLTPALVVGLSAVHKAHFIEGLVSSLPKDRVAAVITEDEQNASRLCEDINNMLGREGAFLYPAKEFAFRHLEGQSKEYEYARLGVLARLAERSCQVVVMSAEAAAQLTIPPEVLRANSMELKNGGSYAVDDLIKRLTSAGYARRPQIDGVAQFSVRGGIIDIFPPGESAPIRIEFWGDEIDSMSYFDIETQRRTEPVERLKLTPAAEVLFESPGLLRERLQAFSEKDGRPIAESLRRDIERLDGGIELSDLDKYIGLAYEKPGTIFDHLGDAVLFVSEFAAGKENLRATLQQHAEDIKLLFEEGELCRGLDRFCLELGALQSRWEQLPTVYLDTFARTNPELRLKKLITVNALQTSGWSGELRLLREDLQALLDLGYACAVLAGTEKAAQTLAADLRRENIPADYTADLSQFTYKKVSVLAGNLSGGFEYPEVKFALLTSSKTVKLSAKRLKKKKGEEIKSLSDITKGDYVVHVTHGIGVFDGIHKIDLQGVIKDYIKIRYAGADTLYVPVTQLDLVSKYIGPREDGNLRLNKLNSGEWQKTRARVKKAVAEMADELIRLYAERMKVKGYAFSEDSDWQRDFEAHFPYEETDDQLRCVQEIKRDMERDVPMERLLCGDVGFGKTEVALRAAFKCVLDSKQCAILCPTTILAWQHYQTVLKRMEGFPIRVELLSRFRTQKQQKEIIKQLKTGEVDIIIGTHRLVQKDIEFKDLGLAIIDEEQRFGVTHKERFKEMLREVDMLTLSATPIPRTLNMAMSGIRDMSVIEEPPQDRHPVQTYVMEYDFGVLCDAVRRELRRNGQVYYIHNRVESIDRCAAKLAAAIPDARIGIAHGKMTEEELSAVWRQLMEHELDILVCTTIIETGVDVPNVNTLIIENADYMGLSQLYQLRGRVGRSNRRAFAYFTFHRGKALSEVATKRLSAIREFTKFGSGFRIALRDLEIRGAGSILGERQHGHMEAVGYDMYLRLLSEAVNEKQGKPPERKTEECLVDIQVDAYIPEQYINNLSQRIDVYKKIACVRTEEDSMDMIDELIDRFGEPPRSVKGLIDVALLRNKAAHLGFTEITQKGGALMFVPEQLDMKLASLLAAELNGRVFVNAGTKPYISVKMEKGKDALDTMREVFAAARMEKQPPTA